MTPSRYACTIRKEELGLLFRTELMKAAQLSTPFSTSQSNSRAPTFLPSTHQASSLSLNDSPSTPTSRNTKTKDT